CQQYNGDPSF
nr:immunoglobulin light chain junction region [Macaca mulatta]MOW51487.1 immunoglobulin light chain junction region [Macaca mulatta]MOW51532.1 immunoglobulin light chain junction region [Macaca mulatta]MOW51673.1 immunoglobulin light chain junction region [Macaca mulatta]MOW51841.1 immunoglobulin light chain junction region [Macaca mulatta]